MKIKREILNFRRHVFISSLLMFASACTTIPKSLPAVDSIELSRSPWLAHGLLMSERIEKKFGTYGVKIISQNEETGMRISHLFSKKDGLEITRVFALTRFYHPINAVLQPAHKEILAGGSIGTTLAKHGFTIKKEVHFKGEQQQLSMQLHDMMNIPDGTFAAAMYQLLAQKGEESLPYCTIIEIYSPDFLSVSDLHYIYPDSK